MRMYKVTITYTVRAEDAEDAETWAQMGGTLDGHEIIDVVELGEIK